MGGRPSVTERTIDDDNAPSFFRRQMRYVCDFMDFFYFFYNVPFIFVYVSVWGEIQPGTKE